MSSSDQLEYKNYHIIKDKLKLFLSLMRDFQNYLRFKSKRDEQLEIDNTQLNLIGEIMSAENLKNLIISVESKYVKEKEQKSKNNNNTVEPAQNNCFKISHSQSLLETTHRNNGSCFGQRVISSKNVLYVSENEKNVVKLSIKKQLKSEIKNRIYSLLLSQDNKVSTSSNFVLRNVASFKSVNSPERNDILKTDASDKKEKAEMKKFPLTERKNLIQRNFVQVSNVVDYIKFKSDYQENNSRQYKIKNNVNKLKELYSNILSNKIYTSNGSLKFSNKNKGTLYDKEKQLDEKIRLIKLDYDKYLPNNNDGDLNLNFIKHNNFLNYNNNTLCRKIKEIKDKDNLTYSPNRDSKDHLPILGKENDVYKTYSPRSEFKTKGRATEYINKWNRKKKNADDTRRKIRIALHYEYR
jgi:hypothetical protein